MSSLRRLGSTFIAVILALSTFAFVFPAITPVSAAEVTGTYMTVSSDYLGEYNLLLVKIVDTEIVGKPNVSVFQGTELIGVYTLNETAISGTFALFLTANGSGIWTVGTKDYLGKSITIVNLNATGKLSVPGDDLTITYIEREESLTVHAEETALSITSVDRTTIPPNATVYVEISDPTANWDPLAEDIKGLNGTAATYANFTLWVNGVLQKAGVFGVDNASETDVNTGVFTLKFNLSELLSDLSPPLADGDVIEIKINDTEEAVESTGYLSVKVEDASLSLTPTYVTYTDPITITLSDFDLNLDTKNVDKVNVSLNGASFTLTETDVDTAVFTGKIWVNLNTTTGNKTVDGGMVFWVPPGESLTLNVTYTDAHYVYKSSWIAEFSLSILEPTVAFEKTQYPLTGIAKIILTLPLSLIHI